MSDIPEEYQISDEEIDRVWGNANFGGRNKRQVILETLLQISGDFSTGHTAMCICQELGLLGVGTSRKLPKLTKKGKRVMYYWNKEALTRMAEIEEGKSVVVPVEPTDAMKLAGNTTLRSKSISAIDIYKAMLAASGVRDE